MPALNVEDLLQYTEWERGKWQAWLHQHGAEVLKISAGSHGDGRFQTIGEIVRHIFSGEKRYLDRLTDKPLSDPTTIPADTIDALFEYGRQSRKEFRQFIDTFPIQVWDTPKEYHFMNMTISLSARKIIFQVLIHEVRHWAQVATMLRLQGLTEEPHDFLFSPVLGGEFRKDHA